MARATKGIPSLPAVLQDLTDPSARTRRKAAKALAEHYLAQAVEPLIRMLVGDPSVLNRQAAAELLSREEYTAGGRKPVIDDPALTPAFAQSLADRNIRVRLQAAQFLSQQGDPRAIEPLLALLKHKEDLVRVRSIRALQPFDDPRVMPALYEQLDDPDDWVCSAAVETLGKRNEPEIAERLFRRYVERGSRPPHPNRQSLLATCIRALSKVSTGEMRQQLVEIVRNQNLPIDLRDSAATILAVAEQEDVAEPLLALLTNPGADSEARRFAAYVLGSLKESRAVKPLVSLLKDLEANVQGAAAEALGKIGDPLVVEALIELLADQASYQEVKGTLLKNEERSLQMTVARALGQIGDVRAIEPLWATFGQNLMYKYEPLRALAWLGDQRAYEPLLFRLRDSRSMSILERDEMAKALVRLAGYDAIEPLDQMLCDHSLSYWVRTACIDALVQLWTTLGSSLALHNLQWFASRQEETPERTYARKVLAELGLFPQRDKEDDHA